MNNKATKASARELATVKANIQSVLRDDQQTDKRDCFKFCVNLQPGVE